MKSWWQEEAENTKAYQLLTLILLSSWGEEKTQESDHQAAHLWSSSCVPCVVGVRALTQKMRVGLYILEKVQVLMSNIHQCSKHMCTRIRLHFLLNFLHLNSQLHNLLFSQNPEMKLPPIVQWWLQVIFVSKREVVPHIEPNVQPWNKLSTPALHCAKEIGDSGIAIAPCENQRISHQNVNQLCCQQGQGLLQQIDFYFVVGGFAFLETLAIRHWCELVFSDSIQGKKAQFVWGESTDCCRKFAGCCRNSWKVVVSCGPPHSAHSGFSFLSFSLELPLHDVETSTQIRCPQAKLALLPDLVSFPRFLFRGWFHKKARLRKFHLIPGSFRFQRITKGFQT